MPPEPKPDEAVLLLPKPPKPEPVPAVVVVEPPKRPPPEEVVGAAPNAGLGAPNALVVVDPKPV